MITISNSPVSLDGSGHVLATGRTGSQCGSSSETTVVVVDDDTSLQQALARLLRSVDLSVEVFSSARELLERKLPESAACIVLDVRLPGLSGLDFQLELARSGIRVPIIFMTGYGDVPMCAKAMKAGATDFLAKPFRDQDMLDAVGRAIEHDRIRREAEAGTTVLRTLFDSLTPREREIMAFVTGGYLNKQVAHELGLSLVTLKIHRGHLMRKMCAKSLADLVRMADLLGLSSARSRSR
jgi:FixJ family two-component response regulator